jgi:hypothetical protein
MGHNEVTVVGNAGMALEAMIKELGFVGFLEAVLDGRIPQSMAQYAYMDPTLSVALIVQTQLRIAKAIEGLDMDTPKAA